MSEINPFTELAEFSGQQAHESKIFRNIFLGFSAVGLVVEGGLKLSGVEVPPGAIGFALGFGVVSATFEFGRRWNTNRVPKMHREAIVLPMLVNDITTTESQINLVIEAESIVHNANGDEA